MTAAAPGRGVASGGFVLVLVLLLFAVGTAVAAAALVAAITEVRIERNRAGALESWYAADAGISHAVASLRAAALPGKSSPPWRLPADGVVSGDLSNGSRWSWSARFKRDVDDLDRDRDREEVVLFNRAFRYAGSNYERPGEGHPVVEITALGRYPGGGGAADEPGSQREVRLDLGRNRLRVAAHAALTARGPVAVLGGEVDGRQHAESGAAGGSCGATLPGIFVGEGSAVQVAAGAVLTGSPGWTSGPAPGAPRSLAPADTPWAALGVTPGDLPSPLDPAGPIVQPPPGTILVVGGSWRLPAAVTSGIVVVHNPLFDARRWDYSNTPGADPAHPAYDARLDRTSPQHDERLDPALFSLYGPGVFRGVIVADAIGAIAGDAVIVGAVISLSRAQRSVIGPGRPRVLASCEAVERAADQGYTTRLGQR